MFAGSEHTTADDAAFVMRNWSDGGRKRWSIEGWPARIFQHEIGHLDGRLMTNRMLSGTLTSTDRTALGFHPASSKGSAYPIFSEPWSDFTGKLYQVCCEQ